MSYSEGYQSAVYRFPAAAIDTAAVIGNIVGPAGKQGKVTGVAYYITVATTVAASTISIGDGTDVDAYVTMAVPIASIGDTGNTIVDGVDSTIDADSLVVVQSDGGATAGDGDILVYINWY